MRKFFTLIELLVVIAIIAVLATVLLPSLSKARSRSMQTACLNNFKQIGMGFQFYEDSYHAYTPVFYGNGNDNNHWWVWKLSYAFPTAQVSDKSRANLLICPGRKTETNYAGAEKSYAMNKNAGTISAAGVPSSDYMRYYSKVRQPSRTYLAGDSNIKGEESRWSWRFFPWPLSSTNAYTRVPDVSRHPGGANILFVDLHARATVEPRQLTDSAAEAYRTAWLFKK